MASWPPPGAVWAMTTSELDQAETGHWYASSRRSCSRSSRLVANGRLTGRFAGNHSVRLRGCENRPAMPSARPGAVPLASAYWIASVTG